MVVLEERFVKYILNKSPARIKEALMDRFGISYNTLRKIEAGSPIRRSLAARIESRLREEWSSEGKAPRKRMCGAPEG